MRQPSRFAEHVLRGYGQMFLANNPVSGGLVLAGLALVSPAAAAWSLYGATIATAFAWLAGGRDDAESGLFGVNGALLGLSWGLFPEVAAEMKLWLTAAGAIFAAGLSLASIRFFRVRRWGMTLFALPYLLAVMLIVAAMQGMGAYDAHLLRGWHALTAGEPARAEREFARVRVTTSRGCAYQHDGLGWATLQQGRAAEAARHFAQARELEPGLWDAATGAGWAAYRTGDHASARRSFEAAVAADPGQAHAWDGLGWVALALGDPRAEGYFRQALGSLPLLADAHAGRSYALVAKDPDMSAWHAGQSASLAGRVSPRWQRVPLVQFAAWLLCLAAIAWHSRYSARVAIATLVGVVLLAVAVPAWQASLSDPALVVNLLALALALNGLYVRRSIGVAVWTLVLCVATVASWRFVVEGMLAWGLPVLSLPFHAGLLGTLLLMGTCRAGRRWRVPLEIASSSPEKVRIWEAKSALAEECWKRLEGGKTI